jgi:hypothetical protein
MHKGYEDWHREYDRQLEDFIRNAPVLDEGTLDNWFQGLYQTDELRKRFPKFNL